VSTYWAVPPFFLMPDAESVIGHFKAIAGAVTAPVYVYNIPQERMNNVTPDMVLKLSEVDDIVGVKDSSRDFVQLLEYLRLLPDDFTVICGTAATSTLRLSWAAGAASRGTLTRSQTSTQVSGAPLSGGDHSEAKRQQFAINVLRDALQKPPIAPHYEALRLRDVDVGVPRAPLRGMRLDERDALKNRFTQLSPNLTLCPCL